MHMFHLNFRRINIRKIFIVIKIRFLSALCEFDLFCLFLNESDAITDAAFLLLPFLLSKNKM